MLLSSVLTLLLRHELWLRHHVIGHMSVGCVIHHVLLRKAVITHVEVLTLIN